LIILYTQVLLRARVDWERNFTTNHHEPARTEEEESLAETQRAQRRRKGFCTKARRGLYDKMTDRDIFL